MLAKKVDVLFIENYSRLLLMPICVSIDTNLSVQNSNTSQIAIGCAIALVTNVNIAGKVSLKLKGRA